MSRHKNKNYTRYYALASSSAFLQADYGIKYIIIGEKWAFITPSKARWQEELESEGCNFPPIVKVMRLDRILENHTIEGSYVHPIAAPSAANK